MGEALATPVIRNPILPGFHPDPSIVRVGDEYVIATSTFEWFPGVRLHRCRDLVRWEPAGHVFTDPAHLDLRDVPDSGGLWAPSLSHSGGLFWLVVGLVHTSTGPFKDIDILLTTAAELEGPWSEPVRLGGGGFDPSIFHDRDGRHWLANMRWDHRPGHPSFAGITLQEVAPTGVVGKERLVFTRDTLVEGPNLYWHDGWYHLMLAEGGTGWNHGILMARSRTIEGRYAVAPDGPLLTSRDNLALPLQKAGHGELVQTPDGEWYLVHLASRPLGGPQGRRCVLGRETCLQRVRWDDEGWLRLAQGGHWPAEEVPAPAAARPAFPAALSVVDDFDGPELASGWCSLRGPITGEWADLSARPGWVRLAGRRSLFAPTGVSLMAQRLRSVVSVATTKVEVVPGSSAQRAGLVCWYDRRGHHLLAVTVTPEGAGVVVSTADGDAYRETQTGILVGDWESVYLRAELRGLALRFSVSRDGLAWQPAGPELDAGIVSDDHGDRLRFTGAFMGIVAEDTGGGTSGADFDFFSLEALDGVPQEV